MNDLSVVLVAYSRGEVRIAYGLIPIILEIAHRAWL